MNKYIEKKIKNKLEQYKQSKKEKNVIKDNTHEYLY